MSHKKVEEQECPKCLEAVLPKLGITQRLFLKVRDLLEAEAGLYRVNGFEFIIGKLSPVNEGLTGAKGSPLGYSCATCGYFKRIPATNPLPIF